MTIDDLPPVLTVEQTAEFLRIGRALAFKSVRDGTIPSIRIGRRILVPRERLRDLLGATPPVD
jgi:excisionase family DNA binding protein